MAERLVKVAFTDNVVEAAILRDLLQGQGIRCLVNNADQLSAYSAGGVSRRIELFVRESDAERAAELLAEDA